MTDEQLDEVLEELGREHRAISAPDSLQRVLYTAAESRKSASGKPAFSSHWPGLRLPSCWLSLQSREPFGGRSRRINRKRNRRILDRRPKSVLGHGSHRRSLRPGVLDQKLNGYAQP